MVADAIYYQSILESLYAGLEALDVTGYAWDPSDGWSQGRYVFAVEGGTKHLEAWIDIGTTVRRDKPLLVHSSSLVFVARYTPDDDARAQARIHAAARAVLVYLAGWYLPTGERAVPNSYELEGVTVDWVRVTVEFSLLLPRG